MLPKEVLIPSLRKAERTEFETDVLVVGGGYAGVFAALRAAEKGQRVLLVAKGVVGKSGLSPWAHTFKYFDESLGDKREDWIQGIKAASEYTANLDYFNMYLNDSLARYNDLVSWGVINTSMDLWDEKSNPRVYASTHSAQDRHLILRRILVDRGISLAERIMLTDLIMQNDRVVGAMGFWMESEEVMIFRAKATILCTGAGSYKPTGFPTGDCTFDGDAMAYRVGASIAGKEYIDFHKTMNDQPGDVYHTWATAYFSHIWLCGGVPAQRQSPQLDSVYQVDKNGWQWPAPPMQFPPAPPASATKDPRGGFPSVGPWGLENLNGAATGMGIHKSEGIWPADNKCFSGITGLYAAGDALASMQCGALYAGGIGVSLCGSAVQGYRAGEAAADYAAQVEGLKPSSDIIASLTDRIMEPRKLERGFNPNWLRDVLHTTMSPYYILYIKDEARLQGALTNVEYMRDYLANRLQAKNPHELRLCHEMKNKVLNAEMKLRASLMRTESRGNHYRRDYPARNDKEWLAWILLSQDSNDKMVLTKKPMPEAWVGDLRTPYKERYPARFPGELEYLGLK